MESNNNNIMCESHKLNITNVISNSVGIRGYNSKGARVSNVICKGSPIPCYSTLSTRTVIDNQDSIYLEIFENSSTDEFVDEELCKPLFIGRLGPLPHGLPPETPVLISFNIDLNGMLTIDIQEKYSNTVVHFDGKNILNNI